jgi:hypothetical protein
VPATSPWYTVHELALDALAWPTELMAIETTSVEPIIDPTNALISTRRESLHRIINHFLVTTYSHHTSLTQ